MEATVMKALRVSLILAVIGAALSPAVSVGQGAGLNPGKWSISSTIVSVDMPGAPPMVAQMMAGKTMTTSQCITAEMAAKGQTSKPAKDCTMTHMSWAGGKMSSEMVCQTGGGTMTTTDTGSFTTNSYAVDGKVVMTGKTNMTQVVKVSGKRVGDC
jgi:hypothetical protein